MAEIIGLVASIGSLVQIAGQITKLSYSYVSDIKSAPKTQKHYLQEVSALTEVLFRVDEAIQEAASTGLDLPSRPPSLNDDALQECHRHLTALHLDLDKRLRRFAWPFQEKEIKKYIDLLHMYRTLFTDFLSTNIMTVANATYKKVAIIGNEQVTQHLFSLFPWSDAFERSRPVACAGTGEWFIKSQTVETWCTGPPSLLWCYGSPGVGKTLLASTTIEYLWDRQACNASSVVYIFCQFSSRDQQDLTAILQCMIRQVIEQADEGLLLAMKQLCADPAKQSTPAGLTELFAAACELKSTYLIVDGPDEVPKAEGLLSYLPFFVGAGCKVMVTSRDLSHIRKHMRTAVKMEVCSQIHDLEFYISSRFQDSEFPDAEDLTQEIIRKSSNVFLHVKLILDELMDLTTIRQMRKALEKESKGLEQAYTSIVQRIDIQPKAKRALAWRFIGWIAFAKRRFKLNEVIHAFAVEKDEEEIHEDNTVSPDLLLQLCIGIVVLFDDKTVGLCHATAYDFFRSTVLVSHDMNTDISETCLRYMCLKPFRQGPCESSAELSCRFHDMVFLGYASRHWGEHLHELEDLEADTESLIQFLILDGNLRDAAVQALHFHNGCETDLSNALFEDMPAKQTALHVAAYWNLTRNLKALIDSALDTSSKDTQGWTPLHYACANGHFASAKLLIESGADIDSSDDQGWTPLFWASFTGSLDIVRLLLSNHAKYTRRSKSGYTALHWAISRGETKVVQALLQHHQTQLSLTLKADIRMLSVDDVRRLSTPVGVSPIQVAAEAKHAPIFDLLVAYLQAPGSRVKDDVFQKLWSRESFKVPVAENAWRTLLKSSRGGKSSKKTKALVHSAESISGQTYLAEDPSKYFKKEWVETSPSAWKAILLGSTIRDGYLNAARLLVETGVDVNFDSKEGPPLHIAACQKDPSFARLLLDKGAKPDRQSGMGEYALHIAIRHGNLETAKVILTSHHDVNFQRYHGTPLHVAAGQEDPRFAELLLENGANPRSYDFHGRNALHIAVMNGFIETARAIIDGGADINQFSLQLGGILRTGPVPRLKTCLMLAVLLADKASGKQEALATEMARMLLSKRADPKLQNSEGETVLHVAAMCGLLSFIEPFMATGARVDTVDNMGRTAIHTMMQFAEVGWDVEDVRRAIRLMLQGLPDCPAASLLNQRAWKPISQDSFNQYVRLTGQVLRDRSASMLNISETFTLWQNTSTNEESKLDTPLTLALRRKAWGISRVLISFGAEIPATPYLQSIFAAATRDLDYEVMDILLGHGVSPNEDAALVLVREMVGHFQDQSPGHERSSSSHRESLEDITRAFPRTLASLKSAGVDVNFQSPFTGMTPLLLAARSIPMAEITVALLEAGADAFHACGETSDSVLTAAVFNNPEPLKHLTAHVSFSPKKPDNWTRHLCTPPPSDIKDIICHICNALAQFGKLDSQNSMGQTLLHLAAMGGNTDLVVSLLDHGAHANIPDKDGWFPIHHAGFSRDYRKLSHQPKRRQHHDTLWHLLPINIIQQTSNHHPYRSRETGVPLAYQAICQEIAEKRNNYGKTMLEEALIADDEIMFSHLLELEADVNSCTSLSGTHNSILHAAVSRSLFENVVSLLLSRGADIEAAGIDGWRPLHVAAYWGNVAIVERLITTGASVHVSTRLLHMCHGRPPNPDEKEWKGQPLHLAAMGGHIAVVELLLKHGADVNATTNHFETLTGWYGPTALHIALDRVRLQREKGSINRLKVASILVENGACVEGVVDQLLVDDIPCFENFEQLWDRLRGYTR